MNLKYRVMVRIQDRRALERYIAKKIQIMVEMIQARHAY
jgi:hypothetical protein